MKHEANWRKIVELHYRLVLAVLLAAAVLVRVGVRMAFGEAGFWTNGYRVYYALAENVAAGKGFCMDTTCAWLPPLYPLFLALAALGGKHYLLAVVPQAMMGAGTALCAFFIGRHLFNIRAGILACGIAAFYPYYAMHDTALQETGMVTCLTASAVCLLFRASRLDRKRDWALAGLVLGLIALTRASAVSETGVALLWTAVWGTRGDLRSRLLKTSCVLLASLAIAAPWLIRTYRLTGAAVLSSQSGRALWIGNDPQTFSAYPGESIDVSTVNALKALAPADQAELNQLAANEIASSKWFAKRALTYIRTHPWLTVQGAFHKLEAGFSWRLNPGRERMAQAAYALAYVPIAVLGIAGMIRARRRRETILIGMLYLSFMAVTVVFWAHTSHRSYLDVYWIVFAASVVEGFRWPGPQSHA